MIDSFVAGMVRNGLSRDGRKGPLRKITVTWAGLYAFSTTLMYKKTTKKVNLNKIN